MANYSTGICANCGADKGLHHYETEQCPKNGMEEYREGRKQEWEDTTWQDSGYKNLEKAAPALLEALIEAKKTIRLWHDFAESQPTEAKAWNYYSASPEMKKINAAIELATGKPCED